MNISIVLSILFMLFWQEELMLFKNEEIKIGKYINDLFYILSQLLKR